MRPRAIDQYYLELSPESFDQSPQPCYTMSVYSVYRKTSETPLTAPIQSLYRYLHQARPASTALFTHRLGRLVAHRLLRTDNLVRIVLGPSF